MKLIKYISTSLLIVVLTLFGIFYLYQVGDTVIILPPQEDQDQEEQEAEVKPEDQPSSASVSLRFEEEVSETAYEEMEKGRLRVHTSISNPKESKRIYRELLNRGGIPVVRDLDDHYFMLNFSGSRVALDKSNVNLNTYALHRPRRVTRQELENAGISGFQAGDMPFLVMPKNWEALILTETERLVAQPLSNYKDATMALHISGGGNLTLNLVSVTQNDGTGVHLNKQIRGI